MNCRNGRTEPNFASPWRVVQELKRCDYGVVLHSVAQVRRVCGTSTAQRVLDVRAHQRGGCAWGKDAAWAATAKRADGSGWWLVILLVPIVGAIAILVFMARPGGEMANRFGASPKAVRGV